MALLNCTRNNIGNKLLVRSWVVCIPSHLALSFVNPHNSNRNTRPKKNKLELERPVLTGPSESCNMDRPHLPY